VTCAALVAIVEEGMSMTVVVVVINTHATVVIAALGLSLFERQNQSIRVSAWTRCWGK
jgi:hypothetical protein